LTIHHAGSDVFITILPSISDSAIQHPDSVRAFHFAINFFERAEKKQRAISAKSGGEWTPAEDAQLCKEFHDSIDFAQIARIHGRSRTEIYGRLVALGKVQAKLSDQGAA
jgi:hypothetical protein